jgi:hypothetical protein
LPAAFLGGATFGDEPFRTELNIESFDDFPGMRLPFVAFDGSKE